MAELSKQLKESIKALKRDWSFLDRFDVPYGDFYDRSNVITDNLKGNGEARPVYVKVYSCRKHPLQRLLRKSRSRKEVHNLLLFKAVGISTPEVLAWGERRNQWGKLIQDFIITEAIPQAMTLDDYLRSKSASVKARIRIARELGTFMRALHRHNFYHKDIHFRNILVTTCGGTPRIHFIDCPRGCFYSKLYPQEHWRIKDLAIIDKYAHILCSDRVRCAFLENYLNISRRSKTFLEEAEKITSFRVKRFDNRKGRTRVQADAALKV